jgi:hypothetical protein
LIKRGRKGREVNTVKKEERRRLEKRGFAV